MTRYVGLDLHKHIVQASLINEERKRLESHRFACTQESLLAFARERLRPEDQSQPEGIRVHKTPALNEVYTDEGLPAAKSLSELRAGKIKILTEMKLLEHASNVQMRKQRFCRRHTQKIG